jgi:hypothetical protein
MMYRDVSPGDMIASIGNVVVFSTPSTCIEWETRSFATNEIALVVAVIGEDLFVLTSRGVLGWIYVGHSHIVEVLNRL